MQLTIGSCLNRTLLVAVCVLLTTSAASAEVLFGDHFDSQPNWNFSQDGRLLSGWSEAQGQNRGGNYEVGYISSAGAHGGSGKGFIQYWDKTTGYSYAQDCWLIKRGISFPDEWYLGYWLQHDPNWDWGGVSSLKLLKVHFNNGATWDIYATNFCAGCPDWRVPGGCGFSWCTDEWGRNWAGCWNDLGTAWHHFIWHFRHSTGTLELYVDGQLAMKTSYGTAFPGSGWDSGYGISFGGNITNGGGGVNEMWTKYDDVVIATTRQEVEAFLGVEGGDPGDTAPPSTTGHQPAKQATNVAVGSNIRLQVQDPGTGVDLTTVRMRVNGSTVTPTITGTSASYTVVFDPPQDFPYNSVIQVELDASDLAGNVMSTDAYSFTTVEDSQDPPPLDPQTFIDESFDDGDLAARGWYDDPAGQRFAQDPERSGTVLEFEFRPENGGQTGAGALRHAMDETDVVHVRYYVKYSDNWSWTGVSWGPHEIYLMTNMQSAWSGPAYTNLTSYIEVNNGKPHLILQDGANIDTDRINEDLTYVTEDRAVAGGNGCGDSGQTYCSAYYSGDRWNNNKGWKAASPLIENGRWYLVEARFQMNSIVDGKGVPDGQVTYWLNHEPVIEHDNVILRTGQHPNMKFNQVMIAPYIHTGVAETQRCWIDDFVVANEYIGGPLPSEDGVPPSVQITSPTAAPTVETALPSIGIGGTASDNDQLDRVAWSSNRGGSGTAVGTTNWSVSTIPLAVGENVITVTATDRTGNTAHDTIAVTYVLDEQPPATPSGVSATAEPGDA